MKVPDEKIIAALLSCPTNKQAAAECGITEKQLYNRMNTSTFKAKLTEAKARLMDGATAALQARMGEAVATMTEIMHDQDAPAQTRLNAAEAVLRNSLKLSERSDILDRLDALEKELGGEENA